MTGTIGRCEMTEELLGVLRSFRIFYLHKNELRQRGSDKHGNEVTSLLKRERYGRGL